MIARANHFFYDFRVRSTMCGLFHAESEFHGSKVISSLLLKLTQFNDTDLKLWSGVCYERARDC